MPTTVEVVHYKFNNATVYCGYLVNPPKKIIHGRVLQRRPLHFTSRITEVDCFKCLKLLQASELGHISRREGLATLRRLHLKRRDADVEGYFLTHCGKIIENSNLEATELALCKNCKKNRPR